MRARTIKPAFFSCANIGELTPLARLLFIGMWCEADRSGRLRDNHKELKARLLPYDQGVDADALINEIASSKDDDGKPSFIIRYCVDDRKYIQIINFTKHQNPHVKEQASIMPEPPLHCASPVQARCKHDACMEVAMPITDHRSPITHSQNADLRSDPIEIAREEPPGSDRIGDEQTGTRKEGLQKPDVDKAILGIAEKSEMTPEVYANGYAKRIGKLTREPESVDWWAHSLHMVVLSDAPLDEFLDVCAHMQESNGPNAESKGLGEITNPAGYLNKAFNTFWTKNMAGVKMPKRPRFAKGKQ